MPKYQITSPDGSIYEVDTPEGVSENEVLQHFTQSNQVSQETLPETLLETTPQEAQQKVPQEIPQETTLLSKLAKTGTEFLQNQQQRGKDLYNTINTTSLTPMKGQQTPGEAAYQVAGGALGTVGDVAGAAVKGLGQGAYSLLSPESQQTIDKYGNIIEEAIGPYAEKYSQNLEAFNRENPRAGRNFQATRELLNLAPVKVAPNLSKSVAMGTVKGLTKPITEAVDALNTKTILPTGTELKQASSKLFDAARETGTQFSPMLIDEFANKSASLLPKGNIAKKIIPLDDADNFIKSLEGVKGQRMTLDDFEAIDRDLGAKAHAAFLTDRNLSSKYSEMQANLRDLVQNEKFIEGDAIGIAKHKEATKLWSIGTRMNDIQRIIDEAEYFEVPSTAIKTGFRRIAKNDKLLRGYSKIEQEAIKRAAKTGKLEGIYKTFGSRLMPIGAGTIGGIPGAALGYGISSAGRAAAESVKKGQAGKINKQLAQRSGLIRTEKRISLDKIKKAMNLSPKEAKEVLRQLEEDNK